MSLVQIMAIKAHTKKVFATLGKKKKLKFNLKERKKTPYVSVWVECHLQQHRLRK